MRIVSRSVLTAVALWFGVNALTIGLVAPHLNPIVGPPDIQRQIELAHANIHTLRLRHTNGVVRVYPHDTEEVKIDALAKLYLLGENSGFDSAAFIDRLLEAKVEEGVLIVTSESAVRPQNIDVQIDLTVRLPFGTNLDIQAWNANTWIGSGAGDVHFEAANADVEVMAPQGSVHVASTNGRIRVIDAPTDTAMNTINGNLYAHTKGGTLKATTVNGIIVAQVLNPDVRSCELNTRNGGITVVLGDGVSAALEATTGRGDIRCLLPIEGSPQQTRKAMQGTIGAGQTTVRADTLNGNIRIAAAR